MLKTLLRRMRQISRRIYVRVGLIAILSLLAVGLAPVLSPFIPEDFAQNIGADSVGQILTILASSMLGVTTFSLTIMVTGLTSAIGNWTPRSQLVLREDGVTHVVLANFVGAYLYSLMAIILRATDVFDHRDIVVLFGVTLAVVALVVLSLIRWIVHLEGMGSLSRTADAIEREASLALEREAKVPCNGAHMLTDPGATIPSRSIPVRARTGGYLEQIFEDALNTVGDEEDLTIYVIAPVGSFLHEGEVLAFIHGAVPPTEDTMTRLQDCMPIGNLRSFDQDPVFGVTVLSEIATRALSPGINDPGTAVDVINRLGRALSRFTPKAEADIRLKHLWIPPVQVETLLTAAYDPISRSADNATEVHLTILNSLGKLILSGDQDLSKAAQSKFNACAKRALEAADDTEKLDGLVQKYMKKIL